MRFRPPALFFLPFFLTGCSHLVYQPSQELFHDPVERGLRFEAVDIPSLDGTALRGWYFPAAPEGRAPARAKGLFVQFHGNAENRSTHFASLAWVVREGYDLLAFDYRGYGNSAGAPDQKGLNQDAIAAILWARARAPRGPGPRLILYGQSLGGAVLMRALQDLGDPQTRADIRLVVADSTFYSYRAISRNLLARSWLTWWLQPLATLLMSDEYSPGDAIGRIAPLPLLVIHGDQDGVIPIEFGEEIYARAAEPKSFWKIPGGHHIDAMSRPDWRRRLMAFLGEK